MNQYTTVRREKAAVVGFFHGIDPATQNDYYTDIVHVLTEKPWHRDPNHKRVIWLPSMVGIMRVHHLPPDKIIDMQIEMFNRFPPMIAQIDSSREEFLSNAMVRRYGENTVFPVKFLNSGNSNTKFQLKQIGYSFLDAGYEWPNTISMEEAGQVKSAKLFKILKSEMMHEQVQFTSSGRVSFDHPVGKHNDLVHGWELSLKGVMQYQEKNLGYEKTAPKQQPFETIQDDMYKDYSMEEAVSGEIYDEDLTNSSFGIPPE
jgi:hypothetical protein